MAFLSLFFGLLAGILLLKLAELLLVNMLHAGVTYTLIVSWSSIRYTIILFLLIFCLTCCAIFSVLPCQDRWSCFTASPSGRNRPAPIS